MPQFDPSSFPSQIFWLIVSFAVFFFILRLLVIPRMADVMQRRSNQIEQDLENAEKMQAEAQQALEEYEQQLAGSRAEAREIVRKVTDEAASKAASALAAKAEELAGKTQDAEARIADARKGAIANIQPVAAEVVQATAERLIGAKVTAKDAETAVADAAKEAA